MMNLEQTIAKTFLQMAEGLETGSFGAKPKIALTGMGSEHGEKNAMEAALMAAKKGVDVYYIGTLEAEGVTTVKVADRISWKKNLHDTFIIIIDDLKPNPGTLCKLVPRDPLLIQILIQR